MAGKKKPATGAKTQLVLVAGRKPQMRKASERSWTRAKQDAFLSALAETCNIARSCEAAGVSPSTIRRKRKSDAAFRAGFVDAVGNAYDRLELVLLERFFNGTEKVVTRKDGSEERMREYSNQLGLALLKMHRDTASEASGEMAPEDVEELRARVLNKMLRLQKRLRSDGE
ncbi:MAG: hypothetical protein ACTHOI_05490 [Sphingomicrobium sp.]